MRVGEIKTTKQIARWRECDVCGYPAKWRITFLDDNNGGCRRNPSSKAYGRDDCSWCSDYDVFACGKHEKEVKRSEPRTNFNWCGAFPLKNFKHMGFYWETVKEV